MGLSPSLLMWPRRTYSQDGLSQVTHTYRESIPGFLRHLLRSPNFWKGAAAAVAIARTKQQAKLATREQLRHVCLLLQVTVACLCLCRQQRHACTDTSIHLDRTGPGVEARHRPLEKPDAQAFPLARNYYRPLHHHALACKPHPVSASTTTLAS